MLRTALLWVCLDDDQEKRFTYSELAAKGNPFLNFLRKNGVRLEPRAWTYPGGWL